MSTWPLKCCLLINTNITLERCYCFDFEALKQLLQRANRNDSRTSQPPPNGAPNKRDGRSDKNKRWSPSPSAPPLPDSTFNRVVAEPPKTDLLQALLFNQREYREADDAYNPEVGPAAPPENNSNRTPHQGHLFRRSKPHN